jgi:hypothetical protein
MRDGPDPLPAFLAAAFASAAATGLCFFSFQPISGSGAIMFSAENVTLAGFAFIAALFVAALHIVILAGPLYALLGRDRPPRPGIVLASATLIGALPVPLISQGDGYAFAIFGLAGLVGGMAFLAVTYQAGKGGEEL